MIKWGHPPRVYTPSKYADDGTISEEYLAYCAREEDRDTLEEERWEAKRDLEISANRGEDKCD